MQTVHEIRIDCDNDVVLLKVTQLGHEPGIACHTGAIAVSSAYSRTAWQGCRSGLERP